MTTKFQREKEKLLEANEKLDKGTDSILEKLKASKWTGLVLAGGALGALVLLASFGLLK